MLNKMIGNWAIDRLLSKGGMGEVYLARHKHLKTFAAVKVLAPTLTSEANFRERFFQEAQTQAQLRHPHIAQVLDFSEQDGTFFEVIEYLPGGTLAGILETSTPPLTLVMTWTKQVLSALSYAHDLGVIHRDIKPSNIMLDQQGNAKLTDFGIAVVLGERRLTLTGKSIGTPEYMSPEQIESPRDVDKRSDIYAMGVVVFEMLTGRVPFLGETEFTIYQSQVNDPPPSIRAFNKSVPTQLDEVVLMALQKAPADRYQSCSEFVLALDSFERTATFHGIPHTRLSPDFPINPRQAIEPNVRGSVLGEMHVPTDTAGQNRARHSQVRLYYAAIFVVVVLVAIWATRYLRTSTSEEFVKRESTNAIQPKPTTPFHEKLLATIAEENLKLDDIFPSFSDAGNKVAYEVKVSSNKWYLVVNGVRTPAFSQISRPIFSPDGSKVAYYASQGKEHFVVVNDWKSAGSDNVQSYSLYWFLFSPTFSADGTNLLYVAGKGRKVYPVSGDWKGPEFDRVSYYQFSADGSTIAYVAKQSSKEFVVLGNWKGPEYDAISWLVLNRDGRKAAYVANTKQNGKEFVVSGDWKSPMYDAVSFLSISADGDKLMYVAKQNRKEAVILNGKQGTECDEITFAELSPDGNTYAYALKQGGKFVVVVNDNPQGEFDQVWNITFSRDGSRVAYCADVGGRTFVVCGDRKSPKFDYVSNIQFSLDGRQIGYGVRLGRELWWKVLDLD